MLQTNAFLKCVLTFLKILDWKAPTSLNEFLDNNNMAGDSCTNPSDTPIGLTFFLFHIVSTVIGYGIHNPEINLEVHFFLCFNIEIAWYLERDEGRTCLLYHRNLILRTLGRLLLPNYVKIFLEHSPPLSLNISVPISDGLPIPVKSEIDGMRGNVLQLMPCESNSPAACQ